MINRLQTILWFLKKPQYIPQIVQVLKRKKNAKHENTREEATKWCEENSISQQEALKLLIGKDAFIEFKQLFPEIFAFAHQQVANCPVEMGGEGAISFLHHLVKANHAKKIIETGVAYGWSSLAILLAIQNQHDAKLISNDMPYIKMNNDDFVGCVIPENLKTKWELQRLPDVKGIPLALKKLNHEIDLCHYDSDKSYTGRMWASPLLWNALKIGGFFVSDDINDNIAFKHFCEQVNRKPVIIEHFGKYVGIIIK